MLGMPLLSAASASTIGVIAAPVVGGFIMNKIVDYKNYREVEACFEEFKTITSNIMHDNEDLSELIHQAFFYKF